MQSTNLPIYEILPSITRELQSHKNLIITAAPGAGKTTEVAPHLMNEAWVQNRKIMLLQPRRLAAMSAAEYISEIHFSHQKSLAGYRVRFESSIKSDTQLEVVTEGIALRELINRRCISEFAAIIFDEFHERNIEADTALAFALDLQKEIPFKIIIMSATLQTDKLQNILGCPVVQSEGRLFPVTVQYCDGEDGVKTDWRMDSFTIDPDFFPFASRIIRKAAQESTGDLLVFLPGIAEIQRTSEALQSLSQDFNILPLSGSLSLSEQNAVLKASNRRKIILSTNIAETSLTIDGVTTVIDSGLERRLQYNPESGFSSLRLVQISKNSATQRSGRAGRTAPGTCIRLTRKSSERGQIISTPPQILSSDATRILLDCYAYGKPPSELAFVDQIPKSLIQEGNKLLLSLGALKFLNNKYLLTEIGYEMSRYPATSRCAAMLSFFSNELASRLAALLEESDNYNIYSKSDSFSSIYEMLNSHVLPKSVSLRIERSTQQFIKILKQKSIDEVVDENTIGKYLCRAFPDRVAKAVGKENRYLLANGKGATLRKDSIFTGEEWLVIVKLRPGKSGDAEIQLAQPVTESIVRELFNKDFVVNQDLIERNGKFYEQRIEKFGEITLKISEFQMDEQVVEQQYSTAAMTRLQAFWEKNPTMRFDAKTEKLRLRVLFLVRNAVKLPPADWEQLTGTLQEWALPFLGNSPVNTELLSQAFHARYDFKQMQTIHSLAPETVKLASGKILPVDYSTDIPFVAGKLQFFLGTNQNLSILNGKFNLQVQLLSPAGRPLQITADLKNFWQTSYPQIRKEMRGRYPKHDWPEITGIFR